MHLLSNNQRSSSIFFVGLLLIISSHAVKLPSKFDSEAVVTSPNGCHIPLSIDEFMSRVAASVGKDPKDLASFTQTLKDNWVTTVDSLWDISDDQWTNSLKFPVGLVNAIKTLLSQLCCKLDCNHGGVPNNECNACINCLGAWTGPTCDTWDPSHADTSALVAQLRGIASDSATNVNNQLKLNPLPTNIGTGVDITTGQLRLPIVKLSYTDSRTWTNSKGKIFKLPAQATFEPLPTGIYNPILNTYIFESMSEYVKMCFSTTSAFGGLFSHQQSLQDVFNKFFNGDSSLAVVQQSYPIYKLTLPIDTTTKTRNYELDPFAKRALDFLPPDYSSETNKALYREFVANWGTSYSVDTVDGGLLEMMSFFQTKLITEGKYTTQTLAPQVDIDFNNVIGQANGQSADKYYSDSRKLSTLDCLGGNAAELCSPDKLKTAWVPSIEDGATPIQYSISDFTELIADQARRSNIQQAIAAYVAEQEAKWANMETCPTCVWGTCTKPAQFCTCENSKIVGRTCGSCIAGWTGAKCDTPVCNGCQHGTCVAPGQCQCQGNFQGADCSQCTAGWSGPNCDRPVCSPTCANGGTCTAPGTCKCSGRHTGPSCTSCIAGWHGEHCDLGQKCFTCSGTGQVCSSRSSCTFKNRCGSCDGTGIIPDNVQRCFRCNGQGEICTDSMCNFQGTCPGCNHKGYIPGDAERCPKCHGTGQVCTDSMCNFKNSCPKCSGHGWVH